MRLLAKPYKFNVIWCHSCLVASFYEYNYFRASHFLVSPKLALCRPDPSCLSHRCLQPSMGPKPLLHQSSLVSDHQSGSGGQESTGLDYPHSTSMEIPGLVSNNPGPPDGLPPPCPTRSISNNTGTPLPPPNAGRQRAVGRMAYIRQSCSSGQLSEKAAELLMASWRSKSHSNYNSLFC